MILVRLIAAMLLALPAAAQAPADAAGRKPADGLRLSILVERIGGAARQVTVEVLNGTASVLCIDRNYGATTKLHAFGGGVEIPAPNAFEGRPVPGCLEAPPNMRMVVSYDLKELYAPRTEFENLKFCYIVRWREGGDSEVPFDRQTRACANA